MNGLNAWCKVTVLRLYSCRLRNGGARALAQVLRLDTTLTSLDFVGNGLGGGRALVETLRLNTTVTSFNLGFSALLEVGGRVLAEALRLNTTVTSLNRAFSRPSHKVKRKRATPNFRI